MLSLLVCGWVTCVWFSSCLWCAGFPWFFLIFFQKRKCLKNNQHVFILAQVHNYDCSLRCDYELIFLLCGWCSLLHAWFLLQNGVFFAKLDSSSEVSSKLLPYSDKLVYTKILQNIWRILELSKKTSFNWIHNNFSKMLLLNSIFVLKMCSSFLYRLSKQFQFYLSRKIEQFAQTGMVQCVKWLYNEIIRSCSMFPVTILGQ